VGASAFTPKFDPGILSSGMSRLYDEIYAVVRRIPPGKVATYGQIGMSLVPPCPARTVGWALAALGRSGVEKEVPWQRVVNSQGKVSTGPHQRELLEQEGVVFDADGRIDLAEFGWTG